MEAGGFESPSGHFYKLFEDRKIQDKSFFCSDLKILRIYQVLSQFIRIFPSDTPVLLPWISINIYVQANPASTLSRRQPLQHRFLIQPYCSAELYVRNEIIMHPTVDNKRWDDIETANGVLKIENSIILARIIHWGASESY